MNTRKAVCEKEFGPIFWFHLAFILFTYLSPVLFDYRYVTAGAVLLVLQYEIFGGCILTHAELGKAPYQSFYWHYLRKLFPTIRQKPMWIFSTIVLPILGVATAVVLQVGFDFDPLIF